MPLFRHALLLCGWLWFFCKQGISSVYHEPLVREGDSYSMTCTGNLSSAEWNLLWYIDNSTTVTKCTRRKGCLIRDNSRFQAVMEKVDTPLTSVLTISSVLSEDRGRSYICMAHEENNGTRSKTLGIWNISRSYLPPDPALTCQADLQDGQVIHLSCTADPVYPGISCQPVQIFNGKKTLLETPMYYSQKPSYRQEYYSASCSGVIFPYVSGAYTFCVNSTTAGQPNNYSCTNNAVIIKNQTTVRVAYDMNTVKICPGEDHFMTIRCMILWWLSPETPITTCSVDDEIITNYTNVVAINRTEHRYASYEWFCSFIPSPEHNEKSVKCLVTAGNFTQAVTAAAKIHVSYPTSKPPQFVYKGYKNTSRTVFFLATNINVSVECKIEGGEPATSMVTVECSDAFISENYRLQTTTQQNKAELWFIFDRDTNCTCTVEHASKCVMNPAANLIFVQEHINSSWSCLSFYCLAYCILAVTAGFGVLFLFVLYWRVRRKHSGTSGYSFFRSRQVKKSIYVNDNDAAGSSRDYANVTQSEVTAYAVVDIVNHDSDLLGFSHLSDHSCPDKQYQNLTSLQNCHLLPKRQQPPLTVICPQHETEKTDNDSSSFAFQDNRIGVRAFMTSNNMTTVVSDYNALSSERLPPVPPRIKLNTKQQFLETPLHKSDDLFSVDTTTTDCLPNADTVNGDADSYTYSNNLQPMPRRPPPPVPCGLRSKVICDIDDGLTARDSTHRNDVCCEDSATNVTAETVETDSSARFCALQPNWPPPPFKARKQTGKKRNASGKSKKRSHAAIVMISSNPNEHLKVTDDTRLDDVVNTYINIKSEPLFAQRTISEALIYDDCCNNDDDVSNGRHQTEDSDVCSSSSLSSSGSSTSCSPTSTSQHTRDRPTSDADSALLYT